jgi:DNA-binding transcriptional LysR family regulator
VITVDVLKTFVAVIDCGTVVGAARLRGYSPAAVSRQMGWLQRRLGVRFFEPHGRSIRATDAALEYVVRAREFVDEVQRFERYSSAFGHGPRAQTDGLTFASGAAK